MKSLLLFIVDFWQLSLSRNEKNLTNFHSLTFAKFQIYHTAISQWRHYGRGGPPRMTPSRGDTLRKVRIFLRLNFTKSTGENDELEGGERLDDP